MDDILDLNKDLKGKIYWKDALRNSKSANIKANRSWFENKRKGYFYLTMGRSGEGRVLNINAGSGIVADVVSSLYPFIVAVEDNEPFIDFMKLRFKQDQRENIRLIQTRGTNLPFRPNTFDLIIIHDLLEWLVKEEAYPDPFKAQSELLMRSFTILKPGGKIAVAIENRLHFNYLLGGTPCRDIPFTTVLPRSIAKWLTWRIRRKPYRTYIYSYWGLKKFLKSAGFNNIFIYIVLPSHDNPILIAPVQPNKTLHEVLVSSNSFPRSWSKRGIYTFLSRLGILRYLLHSFIIVGEKLGESDITDAD